MSWSVFCRLYLLLEAVENFISIFPKPPEVDTANRKHPLTYKGHFLSS